MNSLPVLSRDVAVALHAADRPRLAELCRECTDFFQLVEGQPGGLTTADEILGPLPGHLASGMKRVFGIERAGDLVGVVEILEGFPGAKEWQIGLLLIAPRLRNAGAGTDIWLRIRNWIVRQGGSTVRLVVQKQNPAARRFWEKQGFIVEKEAVVEAGKLSSSAWVMLIHLTEAAQRGGALEDPTRTGVAGEDEGPGRRNE